MQVTETRSEGLKREYRVTLPASDLAERLDGQLADLKDKVRINGFRPGKVPLNHLRKVYGRSIMSDVINNAVTEANKQIVEGNKLRLALEPKIDFPGEKEEVEQALEAKGDLSFTVAVEILPKVDVGSFEDVNLERVVAEIGDEDVGTALDRMANQNRAYTAKEGEAAAAAKGDKVTIDFLGKMAGEPFEGGSGTDVDVVLGSDSFIPGFEEKLEGMTAGESRTIDITFPDNYAAPKLAGQATTFDVTVKSIAAPGTVAIDDDFAKQFNFDSLDKLKDALRDNMQREYGRASRDKLKRALLDVLDTKYDFELPQGLVEQEFAGIWAQVEQQQTQSGRSFADEGTTEEAARADYRRIAERRVRLGLVLAEVGEQSGVQVADEEVNQALIERTRQFPGQEQAVWDYYRKNPQMLGQLRAPIFEEKVVDHIIGQAKVTDRTVSKEDLFKVEDEKGAVAA